MVDMKIFEEALAVHIEIDGYDLDMSSFLFNLCEGRDVYLTDKFGYEYVDGGCDDSGECFFGVFKLDNKLYKAEYYRDSYGDYHTDETIESLEEVKPVEKTITVYESV